MKKTLKTSIALTAALASLGGKNVRGADDAIPAFRPETAENDERQERQVDQAALESTRNAISRLGSLLKKYRGRPEEASFLEKLAEVEQQAAAMEFRIAHGASHRQGKSLDLSQYNASLRSSVTHFNELISRYPRAADLGRAYFLRAKALEETNHKAAAGRDYQYLVSHFPHSDDAIASYMALADLAIDANHYQEAVGYLGHVERHPSDPHYPFALYKLAWAHYNLKQVPKALAYVQREVDYYDGGGKSGSHSDEALREAAALDAPVFYLEGYEEKLGQYQTGHALSYFRRLGQGPVLGQTLGKMLVRYAKLLRAHGHTADLRSWKDQVLRVEGDLPEAFEVLVITYEDQANKRDYTGIIESAQDMVGLYRRHNRPEALARAQKLLLDTAASIQALIVRNKASDEVGKFSEALAAVYDAFTKIVDEHDPRIAKVHYNLAETLFVIRQYEAATMHYRWILAHGDPRDPLLADVSLKAIASRYETLREKKLIPAELAARPLSTRPANGVAPTVAEWVAWVDAEMPRRPIAKIENFRFEANRALYAQGEVEEAVSRLRAFALANPKSQYALPSATLVVDTYVASSDWKGLHALAAEFGKVPEWKRSEFGKRLAALDSDASYKMVEATFEAKDYATALAQSEDFMQRYGTSKQSEACVTLAGKSALAIHDNAKAWTYFSRLMMTAADPEVRASALLTRAEIEEESFLFAAAAKDYQKWLELGLKPHKGLNAQMREVRKRALVLAWLSGERPLLNRMLANRQICEPALADECDRYRALSLIESHARGPETASLALGRARHAPVANRAAWAALGLEAARSLSFRDRDLMLRRLVQHWEEQDPLMRSALLASITESVPKVMEMNRKGLKQEAPLASGEAFIQRRLEAIHELENTATQAAKLPWSTIRAGVTNEMAGAYLDLAQGLRTVKSPRGLSVAERDARKAMLEKLAADFAEKGQGLRRSAFQLASRLSIGEEAYGRIAEPYLADHPAEAKALQGSDRFDWPRKLDVFAIKVFSSDDWNTDVEKCNQPGAPAEGCLRMRWALALDAHNFPQASYLLELARAKKLLSPASLSLMTAASFSQMGAEGEGLLELAEARKLLPGRASRNATFYLLGHYMASLSKERAEAMLNDLTSLGGRGDDDDSETTVASLAAKWAGG